MVHSGSQGYFGLSPIKHCLKCADCRTVKVIHRYARERTIEKTVHAYIHAYIYIYIRQKIASGIPNKFPIHLNS